VYAHRFLLVSQWWERAGKPTMRSVNEFQTLKAKSISSGDRETSESRERMASVEI
jgi:hypothetical protein